ncbi:MAG: ergothioneine biosynthesis protein EgtB [Thiobacillus sp.]|nr:ergothioneine biosynthesis protein EgtB [Thiobacillus sp.]
MSAVRPISDLTAEQLIAKLREARTRLLSLIDCLPADGWLGLRAAHLNPPLWEYGHIVWFLERWCLRAQAANELAPSLLPGADALYDSSIVPHDTRWDLSLLKPAAVEDYAAQVFTAISARLREDLTPERAYFAELCLYHELMHIEAWWMAFQNLGYTPPRLAAGSNDAVVAGRLTCPAGTAVLGSGRDEGFIFDNEKWRHEVAVPAFDIDAYPVSQSVFAEFVDAGGYQHNAGWSDAGLAWRDAEQARHPLYWRTMDGAWQVRRFDRWTALDPHAPVLHVNRYEAEACAHWLGRALPTAGQWLRAAALPGFHGGMAWEWLRDPFAPYPGFAADAYTDYSEPWFYTHGELRGGGPFTDPLLKRRGYRNFYLPHRRDSFAGFRTVSRD